MNDEWKMENGNHHGNEKYRSKSVPVYQSKRRGERLWREGVVKEMCPKFLRKISKELLL
jgi:hypothetical protein